MMTPEIVSQLIARMQSQPRSLTELHRAAVAAGSGWSEEQVALLLECLPQVTFDGEQYGATNREQEDPATRALLELATSTAMPAAVFVNRMPRGVVVTPAALCEIARNHRDLELVGSNRIRRR